MEIKRPLAEGILTAAVTAPLGAGAVFASQELGKNIFGVSVLGGAYLIAACAALSRAIEAIAYQVLKLNSYDLESQVQLVSDISAVVITSITASLLFSVSVPKVALLWIATKGLELAVT